MTLSLSPELPRGATVAKYQKFGGYLRHRIIWANRLGMKNKNLKRLIIQDLFSIPVEKQADWL